MKMLNIQNDNNGFYHKIKYVGIFQEPPPTALPTGSISLDKAIETQLTNSSSANLPYEVC
jgi:hypothetical protein